MGGEPTHSRDAELEKGPKIVGFQYAIRIIKREEIKILKLAIEDRREKRAEIGAKRQTRKLQFEG